jgi:hypothetical protein
MNPERAVSEGFLIRSGEGIEWTLNFDRVSALPADASELRNADAPEPMRAGGAAAYELLSGVGGVEPHSASSCDTLSCSCRGTAPVSSRRCRRSGREGARPPLRSSRRHLPKG